jgi:hypothetical protein
MRRRLNHGHRRHRWIVFHNFTPPVRVSKSDGRPTIVEEAECAILQIPTPQREMTSRVEGRRGSRRRTLHEHGAELVGAAAALLDIELLGERIAVVQQQHAVVHVQHAADL